MFISIEGPDKAGKTTQLNLLKKFSEEKGLDWVFTHNPGDTDLGAKLRKLVLDVDENISSKAELMIYLADRAHHVEVKLKPLLAEGKTIICDRFADSTIAYQGYGRGIDVKTIKQMNALVCGAIKPDLTILLMVSDEVAASRSVGHEVDRLEAQNKLFFVRVRNGYKTIAAEDPTRVKVITVDDLSIEEVHEKVIELIETKLKEAKTLV